MKIEKREEKSSEERPLSSFELGDCIRLVHDTGNSSYFVGNVYIVGAVGSGRRLAISLLNGGFREAGVFVLEPNAKVVIE